MNPRVVFLCTALFLSSFTALADDSHHHLMPGEKVGKVSFPISCNTEAQKQFEYGVALLHSFEYESADQAFQEVVKRDSHCAMAY